ncbi:unnamed protein product [Prorocentrum cordatum]|uniref:Ribosomal RNA large subunit methyltransferase K/L-like methyltransferase domain-containing protein n=1 Tax=Prorocentrum cordatum TaxID=2364126 RepID=A0ABN9W3J3_9DINO|nr:unnamed protein product [Polarella glacialis]
MAGVGSIPAEACARLGPVWALSGDIGKRAVMRQAARNARSCAAHTRGRTFDALRWDAGLLALRSGSVDKVVTDYPWGNRTKADPLLLPRALREIARVLRAGGVAVILLLRTSADRLARDACGLELAERLDVAVSGWPVAVVKLRKPFQEAAGATQEAIVAQTTSICCAVRIDERLSGVSLAEVLMEAWPQFVPNQSSARRAVMHRRVCLASCPSTKLWWRNTPPLGERVVLRPVFPGASFQTVGADQRSKLQVLWETDEWLAVVKPAGMAVLSGPRSLANEIRILQGKQGLEESPPWTVAFDGDARVGGAWLVAKGPLSALALLDGEARVMLEWRAVLRGRPRAIPGLELRTVREAPSVRYRSITEVSFVLDSADTTEWRETAAAAGNPVVGDRPHCDGPAPCVWISGARVAASPAAATLEAPAGEVAVAAEPERFGKLFEKEALVCSYAERGMLLGYPLEMHLRNQEEDDKEEQKKAALAASSAVHS